MTFSNAFMFLIIGNWITLKASNLAENKV